jgi:hypothetical protein
VAIEEPFRHEFQIQVEEVFDAESARYLMAHLPPVPWPEVATKHDLEGLATKHDLELFQLATKHDLELLEIRIDGRLDRLRADLTLLISNQTRTMIFALISALVAIAALALFR